MIKLSNRLALIAKIAGSGKSVVDVGTDHGYLPVYFAEHDLFQKITASDINEGPLSKAKESAEEYDVSDKIEFTLADGLCGLDSSYDTVIIAGMGGETIEAILENAPWTKNGAHLILQPQSKIEYLLPWLLNNGYVLKNAALTKDRGKMYLVLSVKGGISETERTAAEKFSPRELLEARDPFLPEYLEMLSLKFKRVINGIKMGSGDTEELYEILNDIENMRKETDTW